MSTTAAQSSTSLFRRLTWQSTVPIEISLSEQDVGGGSDLDKYYVRSPFFHVTAMIIALIHSCGIYNAYKGYTDKCT